MRFSGYSGPLFTSFSLTSEAYRERPKQHIRTFHVFIWSAKPCEVKGSLPLWVFLALCNVFWIFKILRSRINITFLKNVLRNLNSPTSFRPCKLFRKSPKNILSTYLNNFYFLSPNLSSCFEAYIYFVELEQITKRFSNPKCPDRYGYLFVLYRQHFWLETLKCQNASIHQFSDV